MLQLGEFLSTRYLCKQVFNPRNWVRFCLWHLVNSELVVTTNAHSAILLHYWHYWCCPFWKWHWLNYSFLLQLLQLIFSLSAQGTVRALQKRGVTCCSRKNVAAMFLASPNLDWNRGSCLLSGSPKVIPNDMCCTAKHCLGPAPSTTSRECMIFCFPYSTTTSKAPSMYCQLLARISS